MIMREKLKKGFFAVCKIVGTSIAKYSKAFLFEIVLFWHGSDLHKHHKDAILPAMVFTFFHTCIPTIFACIFAVTSTVVFINNGFSVVWLIVNIAALYLFFGLSYSIAHIDLLFRAAFRDVREQFDTMRSQLYEMKAVAKGKKAVKKASKKK